MTGPISPPSSLSNGEIPPELVDENGMLSELENQEASALPQKAGKSDTLDQSGFLFAQGKYYTLTSKDLDLGKIKDCFKDISSPKKSHETLSQTQDKFVAKKDLSSKEMPSRGNNTPLDTRDSKESSKMDLYTRCFPKNDRTPTPPPAKFSPSFSPPLSVVKEKNRSVFTENEGQKGEAKKGHESPSPTSARIQHEPPQNPLHAREREKNEKQDRQKRDEEGFSGNSEDKEKGNSEDHEERYLVSKSEDSKKCVSTQALQISEELTRYAQSEATFLSEIFNMRVTQFDVLVLFTEILKLTLKSKEQEKIARRQERVLQIQYMQSVADNYKEQGDAQLYANIGAGVTAILSGLLPILGPTGAGKWIHESLGQAFATLKNVKTEKLFENVAKMMFQASEMQKSMGQIKTTFAESNRTLYQQLGELHRSNWEEDTRSIEELKDYWKNIENFINQALQMNHETVRQLFSR